MVTMLRASPRVQWTFFTTPWCTQLDGHRTIGRYKLTPHQPGPSASWRPPAKARDVDGAHAQSIPASAMDLSQNATVSPIGWQSNAWAIQTHPTPTGCVREVGAHTCKPETSMVTMPRVARRVRRTRATTPWCPQLGAHRAFGGYNFSPPQPGASASWRHPRKTETSMVTVPGISRRVRRTSATTPWSPQLGAHGAFGRYKLTPPQPGASASWRPPAKARDGDGEHPKGIPASTMDLFHNAMVSPIGWPSNNWAIQTQPAPTGCVRELATTRERRRRRW